MAVILTVLRAGGDYGSEHVERMRRQCERHAPGVPFQCLTDEDRLTHGWPGWWSKIEALRVSGPALYIDLDMSIVAPLRPLLYAAASHEFVAVRDFNPQHRALNSSLMFWSGDQSHLYRTFAADPGRHMAEFQTRRWWGDQGFIDRYAGARAYWQDLIPGSVVSFKKHCANGVPDGASVVAFHGRPRPWEVGW